MVQTEWHHAAFTTGPDGQRTSTFNITIDATNADDSERFSIRGPMQVSWSDRPDWIGVRLAPAPTPGNHDAVGATAVSESPAISPIGARITVACAGSRQTDAVVTGDSYSAHHAPVKHFGLGRHGSVEYITVRWTNGQTRRLDWPEINRYHLIRP